MKCLARALQAGSSSGGSESGSGSVSGRRSANKLVLAVAAHDVGVLVREVPEKRKVWEGLGVKARVMNLMADSDASVRYEALTAVRGFLEHAFSS